MGKVVWIDLENSPHVPFFLPWIGWLREAGHEVLLTARDLSQTHELLRLHGLDFAAVGGHGGGGFARKALRTLARADGLARVVRPRRPALALGHGSRAQVVAAALLGIPSIAFLDYEYVSLRLFGRLCRRVFFPDAVARDLLRRRGVPASRLVSYPGFKEQVYLDPEADRPAPLDPPLVLARPPARLAHYHTPRSEALYRRLVERLAQEARSCRVLFLPRYAGDLPELRALCAAHGHFRLPERARPARELILGASLVVSGGGTMVREAAVLGVPSASFFGGPVGGVDAALARAGRLRMLREDADVDRLPLPAPRDGERAGEGRAPAPAAALDGGQASGGAASPAGVEAGHQPLPDTARVRAFLKEEVLSFL